MPNNPTHEILLITDNKANLLSATVNFTNGGKIEISKLDDRSFLETSTNSTGSLIMPTRIFQDGGGSLTLDNPRKIDSDIALNVVMSFKDDATNFFINGKESIKEDFNKEYNKLRLKDFQLDSKIALNIDLELSHKNEDLKVLKSVSKTLKNQIEEMEKDGFTDAEYSKLEEIAKKARASVEGQGLKK